MMTTSGCNDFVAKLGLLVVHGDPPGSRSLGSAQWATVLELEAQIRLIRSAQAPKGASGGFQPQTVHRGGSILELCADESGCDFISCVYLATFLR
jgi:hypothetical protein